MKRFLSVFLVCILIVPFAIAEDVDLSGLSFEELKILQTRISKEMTNRPEWKSVPVPPGFYQVGVDIPAGDWCITCGDSEYSYVKVECGENPNDTKTRIATKGWQFGKIIYKEGAGEGVNPESLNVTLIEGHYIAIDYGQAVFSPQERVDLGF